MRPSEVLGISDEILAFDFDLTIMLKGNELEQEYSKNEEKKTVGRKFTSDKKSDMRKNEDAISKLKFAKMKANSIKNLRKKKKQE